MLLLGVREENGWLMSQWQTTYGFGWESILNAAGCMFDYFNSPQVLTSGVQKDVKSARNIKGIEEAGNLTLRGTSGIFHAPLMLTFYNQTRTVEAMIHMDDGEFAKADYEAFNKSLCEFMDSVELSMHKPGIFTE